VQGGAVGIQIVPGQVSAPVHVVGAVALRPGVILVVAGHVRLEVQGQVLDPCPLKGAGDVLHPGAFRIPEAFRPEAEVLLVGAHGEFTGPVAVLLGDVGHDRVGMRRAHELALAAVDGRPQLGQHVGGQLRHLLDGVAGGLKNVLGFRILRVTVDDHLVGGADDPLVVFRDQEGVVQVRVVDRNVGVHA